MDIGVIGEGEGTIIDIFQLFQARGQFRENELSRIKGIVYREKGALEVTEKRELITPLDRIPFPDRDLFKIAKHSYIFSSRGCPYRCVFCASSRFWGRLRLFSPHYVLKEIKELVNNYGVKLISFFDDSMMADKERLKEIVRLLAKENILSKVKFSANARANLLSEEVVRLLKEMNVVSIGMGLESGNARVLRYLKGSNISLDDNKKAIGLLKKFGIAANASFVIGSPDETENEIRDTYNFIRNNPLSLVDAYVLTPFPGTPIWEEAKKKGLVSEEMEWGRLNVNFESNYKDAVILSEILSRKQIIDLYRKFRRQRLGRNLRNIFSHPFVMDIPKVALRTAREKWDQLLRKK